MSANPHSQVQQIEKTLDECTKRSEDAEEMDSVDVTKEVVRILSDICNIVRDAPPDAVDIAALSCEVDAILNKGVKYVHSITDENPFVDSFAHSDASPEVLAAPKDHIETILGHDNLKRFLQIIAPFERALPSDCIITPTQSTPTATFIYQARCEITTDPIGVPLRARISSGGSCLAVNTAGGWKYRDAILNYLPLDNASENSKSLKARWFNARLNKPAPFIALNESRKLLFAADDERIKSFAWATPNGDLHEVALPVHTMNSKLFQGPLAILQNRHLIRAGKGSVGCWNLDSVETHGSTGDDIVGKYLEPCNDDCCEEENSTEPSGGSKPSGQVKFADPTLSPTVWQAHPTAAGSMICGFDWEQSHSFSCYVVDLWHGGSIVSRFLGHGDGVLEISTNSADPQVFVTGCSDGYARLYDVRQPLPTMTFNAGRSDSECSAVTLAYPDGIPTLFTGSRSQQEVRLWDIRAQSTVYELSTGNTNVASLVWDDGHNTLYAATECDYIDHIGHHDYRRAKEPKFTKERREQDRQFRDEFTVEDENKDDEDDYDSDDENDYDSDDDDEERGWPKRAFRGEEYYGYLYDAGDHMLIRYKFKEEPDTAILPEYGNASVCDDRGYW
ncbi:hypothetical protein DXG01_000766 [Tephrocybe rancida]|nr:hypothetical protein DXG01_000766 [Tephrocybe rancida]